MSSSLGLPEGISPSLSTFYVCIALLIVLCCLASNLVVVTTIYGCTELLTPLDFYILNLSVCDIVSSLFGTLSVDNVHMNWKVAVGFCKASYAIVYCCYAVVILNLCAMSIERYHGICRPVRLQQETFFRKSHFSIPAIWFISAMCFAVYVYAYGVKLIVVADGTNKRVCDEAWDKDISKFFFLFVPFLLLLVAPMAVIIVVYIKIMQKLGTPRSSSSGGNAVLYMKRKRTVRMLSYMILLHYISWTPTILLKLANSFSTNIRWYWTIWALLELLHYARPLCYPLIYFMMYHNFRSNLRSLFRSCVPCSRPSGTRGENYGNSFTIEGHSGSFLGSDRSMKSYGDDDEYCTDM